MTNSPMTSEEQARLALPSYDDAYGRFLQDAFRGFVQDHSLLGEIEAVRDRHAGPIRNVDAAKPLDQPMVQIGAPFTLETAAIASTDVEAHTAAVAAFAAAMVNEQVRLSLQNIGGVADAVGNTVLGVGPPTVEQFRELFRKMDISFNEDGTIAQTLVVPPEAAEAVKRLMSELDRDPGARHILAEKRAAWEATRAARAHRTLSR
jgi:hypothetical protein